MEIKISGAENILGFAEFVLDIDGRLIEARESNNWEHVEGVILMLGEMISEMADASEGGNVPRCFLTQSEEGG